MTHDDRTAAPSSPPPRDPAPEFTPTNDPTHAYWDEGNPSHPAALERVRQRYAAKYPDPPEPDTLPPAHDPTATLLPTNPRHPYYLESHPGHAAAVAAIQQRYAERLDAPGRGLQTPPSILIPPEPEAGLADASLADADLVMVPPMGQAAEYSREVRADITDVAEAVGLAPNVRQTVLDAYAEGQARGTLAQSLGAVREQVPPSPYTDPAQGLPELQRWWGPHCDGLRHLAGWAADNRGLRPFLEQTGYALHPEVVAWLARAGARDVKKDLRSAYHHPGAPGHREQVAALAQLAASAAEPSAGAAVVR